MSSFAPPKLMFFGDPSGPFHFVICCGQEHHPEAIVLLGDIQAQRLLVLDLAPVLDLADVWFTHGNHDTASEARVDHLFGSALERRNPNGCVVELAGLRVAVLGGIFRESIWAPPFVASVAGCLEVIHPTERWRGGMARRHRSPIFPDEYERLARQRVDILVTHEGLGGHSHDWVALDDLAIALYVQVVVDGHLHRTIAYLADGRLDADTGYQAFGVASDHCLIWLRPPALVAGSPA